MGRNKRNKKHGDHEGGGGKTKKSFNLPPATGKLFWSDGFWTDPRLNPEITQEEFAQIREQWKDLEWVKTTEWYKEKKEKGELEKH